MSILHTIYFIFNSLYTIAFLIDMSYVSNNKITTTLTPTRVDWGIAEKQVWFLHPYVYDFFIHTFTTSHPYVYDFLGVFNDIYYQKCFVRYFPIIQLLLKQAMCTLKYLIRSCIGSK